MKQYNEDLGYVMNNVLQQHTTSVQFEDIWNKILDNKQKMLEVKKVIGIRLVAIISLFTILMVGFTGYNILRRMDRIDYPFIDDPRVLGKWESVDFVTNIEDFKPEKKYWEDSLFLDSLVFVKEGKLLVAAENGNFVDTTDTWTKDMVLSKQNRTAERYIIEEIDGTTYMFFEWKSGDYIYGNHAPGFYVLKKIDSEDYSGYQVKPAREDMIDYPFIDDMQMRGKWESVDYVLTDDSFKPGVRNYLEDFYLTRLNFKEDGKLTVTTSSGSSSDSIMFWTKGLVINKRNKTASKCETKVIDGNTYMFFEWKTSDYIYGGLEPGYYVLKKVE